MYTDEQYTRIVEEWKTKQVGTEAELDMVLNNFRILFAYNSGAIEF